MKGTNTKTFVRRTWFPTLAALALVAGIAIITMTWHSRPTQADPVDCSGSWWTSGDPVLITACSDQKVSADDQAWATEEAQPYVDSPPVTEVLQLPEPNEARQVHEWVRDLNSPALGPVPREWKGATSVWRDGAVPTTDYMAWTELYVVSRPTGAGPGSGLGGPTLETMLLGSVGGQSQYVRQWTCPQSVGALHITKITNPDYTNTNPKVPYPGLQSVVYFTTDSSSWPKGSFDMATEAWTLNRQ